jgi:hypothetical protein
VSAPGRSREGLSIVRGRSQGKPRETRAVDPKLRGSLREERSGKEARGTGLDRGKARSTALSRDIPLSSQQIRAVGDLGAFRSIRPADLRLDARQVRELSRNGLVRDVQFKGEKYLTLSNEGCKLARKADLVPGRKLYAGPRKLRDCSHDSAIYTAYVKACDEIEKKGGRVTSFARDEDLRRHVLRDRQHNPADTNEDVAARHGVGVDETGKLQYPDIQIHYEMPAPDTEISTLEVSHATIECTANIEIVTDAYSGADIAAKGAAGFTLVSAGGIDLGAIAAQQTGGGGVPIYSLADDIINF